MKHSDTEDHSPVERHVQNALSTSTDPEVRYHLRQALQLLTE